MGNLTAKKRRSVLLLGPSQSGKTALAQALKFDLPVSDFFGHAALRTSYGVKEVLAADGATAVTVAPLPQDQEARAPMYWRLLRHYYPTCSGLIFLVPADSFGETGARELLLLERSLVTLLRDFLEEREQSGKRGHRGAVPLLVVLTKIAVGTPGAALRSVQSALERLLDRESTGSYAPPCWKVGADEDARDGFQWLRKHL